MPSRRKLIAVRPDDEELRTLALAAGVEPLSSYVLRCALADARGGVGLHAGGEAGQGLGMAARPAAQQRPVQGQMRAVLGPRPARLPASARACPDPYGVHAEVARSPGGTRRWCRACQHHVSAP